MKKLFLLSVVICAASFIMAAITYEIFGGRPYHGGDGGYTHIDNFGTVFNETVDCSKEWHINNEFSHIEVDSAAVKTLIVPTAENEMIRVCAQVPSGKSITVSADWDDDRLCIAAHPKAVTFEGILENGMVSWLDDIFGDSNGIVISIEIPERILESFTLKQGSGTTIIRSINSAYNNFEIGSGTVNFYGSGQYAQKSFNLDLGSGKACFVDMLANYYDIDIGSGKFAVSGLRGTGEIDFGSGKGSVFYSQFGGCNVDMGSGKLDLYFPEESSAYVDTDIGSGYVNIDALGVKQKLNDDTDERVLIGSYSDSTSYLNIDMGSGIINIFDSTDDALSDLIAEYAVEAPSIPPKPSDTAPVEEAVQSSITPELAESALSEGQSAETVIGEVTKVDEPTPPEAVDEPTPPEDEQA